MKDPDTLYILQTDITTDGAVRLRKDWRASRNGVSLTRETAIRRYVQRFERAVELLADGRARRYRLDDGKIRQQTYKRWSFAQGGEGVQVSDSIERHGARLLNAHSHYCEKCGEYYGCSESHVVDENERERLCPRHNPALYAYSPAGGAVNRRLRGIA